MVGLSVGLDFLNEKLAEPMNVLERACSCKEFKHQATNFRQSPAAWTSAMPAEAGSIALQNHSATLIM
jgi:hypothetical protein